MRLRVSGFVTTVVALLLPCSCASAKPPSVAHVEAAARSLAAAAKDLADAAAKGAPPRKPDAGALLGNDRQRGGWLDAGVVVNAHCRVNRGGVAVENGTGIPRVLANRTRGGSDLAAFVNLYYRCWGNESPGADPNARNRCIGFGSGISVLDPRERFYPISASFNFGHVLTFKAAVSLWKRSVMADNLIGDILTGATAAPSADRLVPGLALVVAVDPFTVLAIGARSLGLR